MLYENKIKVVPPETPSDDIYRCYSIPGKNRIAFKKNWVENQLNKTRSKLKEIARQRERDLCIIVGNGPSLSKINVELLSNQDIFVSNNIFFNEPIMKLAKYYAVSNFLVAEQEDKFINSINGKYKFFPYWLGYCMDESSDTLFLNADPYIFFSKDAGLRISWSSTVSYFMMQIVYTLGYQTVALIGFDHSYEQDVNLKEGDIIVTNGDDINHFDKRYFKGKKWQAANVQNMETVYLLAKKAFEEEGNKIINATGGGNLEVFRRDNLENLVKEPDKKTTHQVSSISDKHEKNGIFTGIITPINYDKLPIVFDGGKCISGNIDNVQNSSYEIDVMLKPDIFVDATISYTETTPPMPLLIEPLAIYQISDYLLRIKLGDHIDYFLTFIKEGWYQIKVDISREKNSITLLINDKLVAKQEKCYIPLKGNWFIGKGYLNRFWEGKVGHLKVCEKIENYKTNLLLNVDMFSFKNFKNAIRFDSN
jgi:hypothetical protein